MLKRNKKIIFLIYLTFIFGYRTFGQNTGKKKFYGQQIGVQTENISPSEITPEHAIELHRLISNSALAIIPGGHGEYIGEITTLNPDFKENEMVVPLIEKFLDKKVRKTK